MGYKMTPEHRIKIGEANKRGKITRCVVCGKEFYLKRWEEKRNPPRKCCCRKCFIIRYNQLYKKCGKENYFWENGKWGYVKRQVLIRDNFTCKKCGFSNKEIMEVDHILEKMRGGTDTMENLQTLCPNCHAIKTNRFLKNQPFAGK
jgi:5-methylcytosine-specific restriction endonuclease McrA